MSMFRFGSKCIYGVSCLSVRTFSKMFSLQVVIAIAGLSMCATTLALRLVLLACDIPILFIMMVFSDVALSSFQCVKGGYFTRVGCFAMKSSFQPMYFRMTRRTCATVDIDIALEGARDGGSG